MKNNHQICNIVNKQNNNKLQQNDILFNTLQSQQQCLTYSIQQFQNTVKENLEIYFKGKKGFNDEYFKSESLSVKNSLNNLIRKMILKIQSHLSQNFEQNCNKIFAYGNSSLSQQQLQTTSDKTNVQKNMIKKTQLQNQILKRQNLQLKIENKDLKNSILILNQAYQQSKIYFQQEIKELRIKFVKKQQKDYKNNNPYQLNIPNRMQLSSRDIQSTKNQQLSKQSQKTFMRKSNNDIQISTIRTRQVRSVKGCTSISSRDNSKKNSYQSQSQSQALTQLKIKRLNQENKRMRDLLNQINSKFKIELKNNENLMKQLYLCQCQKNKLEDGNRKKRTMIEQLMKRIQEKYQI